MIVVTVLILNIWGEDGMSMRTTIRFNDEEERMLRYLMELRDEENVSTVVKRELFRDILLAKRFGGSVDV